MRHNLGRAIEEAGDAERREDARAAATATGGIVRPAGTFGWVMAPRRAGAAIVLALLAPACGSSGTTAGLTLPKTETFSGTLAAKGAAVHQFTVAQSGLATLTLAGLSFETIVGIGIGLPSTTGSGCSLVTVDGAAGVGTAMTGTIDPGNYCVGIYDVGGFRGSVSYVLTLTHF